MAKFVLVTGPQAVGKMTVGEELARATSFKFMHNHVTGDLAAQFFDWGTEEHQKLTKKLRFDIFESIAKSNASGFIFTFVWAFNLQEDWEYVEEIKKNF